MYTATLIGDTKNIELRRRMINVQFSSPEHTFAKEFQFRIDETPETMKRTVKQYLNELNFVPLEITDLTYTEPTPVEPTAAELAKQTWQADWAKLQEVDRLIAAGVLTGNEAPVTTLRNKVKADFKPAYL